MRAIVATGRGGNEVLELQRRAVPSPGPGELLVRVAAAAVNPRDWMIRSGRYPLQFLLPKSGLVLGSDLAGEVVALGGGCTRFNVGDRVHAMQPGRRFGAFADYAVVPEGVAAAIPEGLSDAEAAAMTLVGLTAWQGLVEQAKLERGQEVLVIGASGGVGHMAVQVAVGLGARVTGVCSADSAGLVRELGAAEVIDRKAERFQDTGRRWDVIFDAFGAAGFGASRVALADGGVYVSTWPTPKVIAASLATRLAPRARQCRLVAVRSDGEDLAALDDLVARGSVRPRVARTFPLEEVAAAFDASRSFSTRGKLVLEIAR
ncbi:MAG: NADP-dependent oxidoreductase [Gammaproteobacteria bacterium]